MHLVARHGAPLVHPLAGTQPGLSRRSPSGRSNYVSNPRKTARDRAAYIARHRVNENHNDPLTPGALSRWLLWGESRSLARNTAAFRRRFRLQ